MSQIKPRYYQFLNHIIGIIFILGISSALYAAPPAVQPVALSSDQPEFNLKQANKTFDQLNLKLSVENLNIEHLEAAIATLTGLINDAKTCISLNQKKLSSLDNLLKENNEHIKDNEKPNPGTESVKNTEKTSADLVYVKQEQKNISDKLGQCRLFSIRAQEAINTYQLAISKIKQKQVLTRGLPLWSLWDRLQHELSQTVINLPPQSAIVTFIQPIFTQLCILVMLCGILSIITIRNLKSNSFTQYIFRVRHIGFYDGLLLFLSLLVTCLSLYFINTIPIPNNLNALIGDLVIMACVFFWTLAAIIILFKSKIVSAIFFWYSLDGHFFRNVLIFLLSYYTISKIGGSLIQTLPENSVTWQLSQTIFITGVVITAIGFVYYFCHTHRHIQFIRTHHKILQRTISLLFISYGIINLFGYHQLAIHLIYASITTFAILFTVFLLSYAIQKLYLLAAYPSPIYRSIMRTFGYKTNQTVIEFIILKITLQTIVSIYGLYFIGQTWGYGAYYINSVYTQVFNGIHFSNFTFYPNRIVAGLIVFCLLYLFFRSVSTKFSRHTQFEEEEETQVAIASILTYIGFTCAFVAALLVSGIDFTGLAIVAGALSVGIGLGLQSIVNNFVSGIILLLEKPIKPGDHINIDGIEGIVKKIRVRSTQITTSKREDVIIPNSDLITRSVTNYMYTDRYLSISCEVGVAYDSDPELVKKLLTQAISDHDEIIKSPRAKSTVLLDKFGSSAIIFQIWFLIKDGNKKAIVRSDVNFKIERLFREHGIQIAHPQRDINIKLSEIPTELRDK